MAHSTWKIIAKNTFTLFNLVNVILAAMVASVGSYKNMLFIIIAIANTLISIINELRAKKIVDKLKLLSEKNPVVLKNGTPTEVSPDQVTESDILVLTLGDQIIYDSVLEEGTIEVNEAFITGEQENITKRKGDKLISGSFIVAGSARAKVENIGANNFVTKLETEAKSIKTADSKLFKLMNNIVRYISYTLIPIGALLLWARFRTEPNPADAVTSTVAALINMIPEGLILLTSSVLALATVRLSKRKILVQDLYAIETLARVDTICLDKTGTLTTGKMTVNDLLTPDGTPVNLKNPTTPAEKRLLTALVAILSAETAENATTSALRKELAKMPKINATDEIGQITDVVPFSSDRKYSGVRAGKTTYLMGAIDFITTDKSIIQTVKSHEANYRTLAVVEMGRMPENVHERTSATNGEREERLSPVTTGAKECAANEAFLASGSRLLGIIRLSDEIRPTAPKIIDYFYSNAIDVKIISGDDLAAVTEIAEQVGVRDLRGVNLASHKTKNYAKLVQDYAIFTRVTPAEKKELIKALRTAGKTVAMTGDGVNDILAMKEADASLAIGEGSDAARRAAKFVLLDSGFEAVPRIIDEGRQSINNLERSTSLFLAKTVYATILAVVFVFLPFSYPFKPIEMSLLNFACIGFPGLILALEKNTDRVKDKFVSNILTYSLPIGLTVSFAMIALSIIAGLNDFPRYELSTAAVATTFIIDLILIYWISRPLNKLRATLLVAIIAIMAVIFLWPFARDFFEFTFLTNNGLIITLSLILASTIIFELLRRLLSHLTPRLLDKF
ncbi:cation-translocating P-type ATPase [Candidatus Saccharibacteria bacterium]|nr:cation-translocating P-type ATPase [Candidatus Saccharibacteria bacterium]